MIQKGIKKSYINNCKKEKIDCIAYSGYYRHSGAKVKPSSCFSHSKSGWF